MVTNLTQLGYVNNYDKNRYLENFSKAAVYGKTLCVPLYILSSIILTEDNYGFKDKAIDKFK